MRLAAKFLFDAEELIVFGEPIGAGQRSGFDLAAVCGDSKVGNKRILGKEAGAPRFSEYLSFPALASKSFREHGNRESDSDEDVAQRHLPTGARPDPADHRYFCPIAS